VPPPHIRDIEGRNRLLECIRSAVRGRDATTGHAALVLLWASQHLDNLWRLEAHLGERARAARSADERGRWSVMLPPKIRGLVVQARSEDHDHTGGMT